MEPTDIPNVGRQATILAPTGGAFSLFKSEKGDNERERPRLNPKEAHARITKAGGIVLVERIDVPRLGAFGVAQDPQGAKFCVFESVETLV
jgi:predicted enzyme related to lactoylglutathione lyase